MSPEQILAALRTQPAWAEIPDQVLLERAEALLEECTLVEMNGGDIIAEYLDDEDGAWLVLLGSVDEWSSERRLAIRGMGQFTGELAVFGRGPADGDPKAVEIVAREEGLLLQIPGQLLRDITTWIPGAASIMLKEVARHGMCGVHAVRAALAL